jgi:hypothetical protein
MPLIDLTGHKYGRLTVVRRVKNRGKHVRWFCKCECGGATVTSTTSLRQGNTQSCGCLQSERARDYHTTHNKSRDADGKLPRLYRVWSQMRQRCRNPNNEKYIYYGERGIGICEEWEDYQVFYDWAMANGYRQSLSIDRIDNNGWYEPENCRWATVQVQNKNKGKYRNSRKQETMTIHG